MKYRLQLVIRAIKQVLKEKNRFVAFGLLTVTAFWIFVSIPVRQIPGNTYAFQLSLFSYVDWALLLLLSALTGLSLTMNSVIIRNEIKRSLRASTVGRSSFGLLSGIAGSLFGPSASCASCVSAIFGFLGMGGVLFLLQYRQAIVIVSILIMLVTLYYSSKKVLGICVLDTRKIRK
ncbi:hypothetical protein HY468_00575 [Candidatus Roizmanbacteria bacterium]|nr:hypothetical protein [Candidatus Roizmanbacteria bacterium]